MRKFQTITFVSLFLIALLALSSCSNAKKSMTGNSDDDTGMTTDTQNDSDSNLIIDNAQDSDGNGSDSDNSSSDGTPSDSDTIPQDSDTAMQDSDTAMQDSDKEIPDVDSDSTTPDGMGPGSTNPYNPGGGNADSVVVDDDGKLKLDSETESSKLRYLWVSNSTDGTISKIDTFDKIEVARYHSGLSAGSNPSRTTVDLVGNMFVGNRDDSSITKIAGTLDRCVDKNHNGTIETSGGSDDVLARDATTGKSTEECVLWIR